MIFGKIRKLKLFNSTLLSILVSSSIITASVAIALSSYYKETSSNWDRDYDARQSDWYNPTKIQQEIKNYDKSKSTLLDLSLSPVDITSGEDTLRVSSIKSISIPLVNIIKHNKLRYMRDFERTRLVNITIKSKDNYNYESLFGKQFDLLKTIPYNELHSQKLLNRFLNTRIKSKGDIGLTSIFTKYEENNYDPQDLIKNKEFYKDREKDIKEIVDRRGFITNAGFTTKGGLKLSWTYDSKNHIIKLRDVNHTSNIYYYKKLGVI